jgi:hypothetical protein
VSSPYNQARDGNAGGYGFGDPTPGDLASDHEAQTAEGFDGQLPGDPHPGADLPPAGRFTYPYLRGPGGALADD